MMDESTRDALEKFAAEFRIGLAALRDHIDTKFDNLSNKYISKELHGELEKRVASLEVDRRKVAWIIVSAVLGALLAGVILSTSISRISTPTEPISVPVPTITVTRTP